MRRLLLRHPFLGLGLLGLLLMLAWSVSGTLAPGHPVRPVLSHAWTLLLRPFALVATWIDPLLRRGPAWLDTPVTVVLGLLPYALADVAVRRIVRRRGAPAQDRRG